MLNFIKKSFFASIFILMATQALALRYDLPPHDGAVVGQIQKSQLTAGKPLSDLLQYYDVGYYEFLEANPQLNPLQLHSGMPVVLPTQYVLPQAPHLGIVINLAELRLYYFPPAEGIVYTDPIGIGRQGWNTPEGTFLIKEKIPNPSWNVPASIAAENAKHGIILPKVEPPGPDNPLGNYAMRLSLPNYLIHGTNHPEAVGLRVSSGCIRMYPKDVENLFNMVVLGTPVTIVNQPFKAGWLNGKLYLEAHQPLSEERKQYGNDLSPLWHQAIDEATYNVHAEIDWNKVAKVAAEQRGIPEEVGHIIVG